MVSIAALRAEHHESGFGISHREPRLSWSFEGGQDWTQASYEVALGDETRRVDSNASVLVPWPFAPLHSRDVARVKVRAQGGDGWTDWASLGIEIGLLERDDWRGTMITGEKRMVDEPKRPLFLRKSFEGASGSARLYATAWGVYNVYINGQRVSDQVLAPGWQSYRHHLSYQVYDISSLIQPGQNTIVAYVGEGWYATRLGRPGIRNIYGDQLGFMGQVEVDRKVVVATDETWEWGDGPILTSEIYNGERYDTRLSPPQWWLQAPARGKAQSLGFPKARLRSTDAPPVRRVAEVNAKEVLTTPSGKTVLDFGQNLVGWLRINGNLQGTEVTLRFAEVLENGELGTRPLRTAEATDKLILGGETKGWEPSFTFHGFRYAEVTGIEATLSTFTAVVISSNMRRIGTFDCSHSAINQLHSNVVWSMMGNFVSVPTDCPQRDERLGWTGDLQVFGPTASYLFDTAGLLSAWLEDLYAEQQEYGGIPPEVVPVVKMHGRKVRPMGIWADVAAITPWDLYNAYGDVDILKRQFDSMALWLDKGVPRCETGLWDKDATQYGDWLDPRAPPQLPAHGQTDPHYCVDAYLVYVTGLVSRIAKIIGSKEQDRFAKQYAALLREFRAEYVSEKGRVTGDTQTAFALAIKFGLLDQAHLAAAGDRLGRLVRWDGFRISTGFAGTPIILDALAQTDQLHLAYRMLQEGGNPSWLYPVSMGATTIWERWDSMLPDGTINPGQMTSFNHYALGAVAAFLHHVVGGLSPGEPGWKSAIIEPKPGGTITHASTSYDSPYGLYAVSWKIASGNLDVEVTVPPNATAVVRLPGLEKTIGSGKQSFQVAWKADSRWPPSLLPGPQSVPREEKLIE